MAHCTAAHSQREGSHKLILSIVLNFFTALVQAVAGLASGSLALVSDAAHNFSDVISLIVSYIAQQLSGRSSTSQQTFGFKRAEIIAAMINSSSLFGVAFVICHSALERLWQPVEIHSNVVIWFAGLGIVVNASCALLLKPHSSHNLNMKSAYMHLVSDMVTSIAVLLGGVCIYLYGWTWIDSLLSMVISLYLVYSAWGILLQATRVLMQFSPREISLDAVGQTIVRYPEIANIHHVHCWQLNDKEIYFEAHLDFHEDLPLSRVSTIIKEIGEELEKTHKITHTILQAEIGMDDGKELIARKC
jgi:cobalt-zinc-cadmium efflux system protein